MIRLLLFPALLRTALAAYDEFSFSTEESQWQCPDLPYNCVAPSACAHEGLLDKYYCCGVGSTDAVCWSGSTDCANSNNKPDASQIACSSGDDAYCCLDSKEQCTQRFNQINICWATPTNPLANITEKDMNATFSSLLSASASATALTFQPADLLSTSTPLSNTASVSTTGSGAPSSASATTTPTTSPSPTQASSSSGLSGGAIGGIVVGVIAGIAIVGAGAFFLWRRRRNNAHGNELDSNPYVGSAGPGTGPMGYGAVAQGPPHQEKYAHRGNYGQTSPQPAYSEPIEMDSHAVPVEVEGSGPSGLAYGHSPRM